MEMAGSKQSTGGGRMRAAALPPKATINDNQADRPHKKVAISHGKTLNKMKKNHRNIFIHADYRSTETAAAAMTTTTRL